MVSGWHRCTWIFVLFGLLACTSTTVRRADDLKADSAIARGKVVLLLPPEVQLTQLTASGMEEPRADWTASASALIERSLRQVLDERSARLAVYAEPEDAGLRERFQQLRLLHDAVGASIASFGMLASARLASKGAAFDWTLGPGVRELKSHFHADYALYTSVYDSYASGGRKSIMALGLLLGANVSLGQRYGYSSLVDLDTGKVLWTGFLLSSTGDLREAEGALAATRQLLKGVPL